MLHSGNNGVTGWCGVERLRLTSISHSRQWFQRPEICRRTFLLALVRQRWCDRGCLEFREYAAYLRRGLAQAGYSESATLDQADLAIFVSYGIGDAKEQAYSYSMPVYGQTGGGTYNFSGTTYSDYGGTATTYGTATQTPQYGVVGSEQFSGTTLTYLRYLSVDVFDMKALRNEKNKIPVWRMDVMSRGRSDDLRSAFPVLVAAATPHFGKNTKKQIVVDISGGDKQVQQIITENDTPKK